MPNYDPRHDELQLNTLVHRGQWAQALQAIDTWLAREPWRTELLLRKAQTLRAMKRFEQGLDVIRAYRAQKPDAGDIAFQEIEMLLELRRTHEAMEALARLPAVQANSAQAEYYRGRVLLLRRNTDDGLQALWNAYTHEPGFNRALVDWAVAAHRAHGKWRTRRRLQALLARHAGNPTVAIGVGLALAAIDARTGGQILRRAVERYPEVSPSVARRVKHTPVDATEAEHVYRAASEAILCGHCDEALDAYYRAVARDPVLLPLLAPLVAEVLLEKLMRPEEARLVLEEALRQAPGEYRLHVQYAQVFLRLGFGEEALSAANCALALAPDAERPLVLVRRAGALALLRDKERAFRDLADAVAHLPEARALIRAEAALAPFARDPRYHALLAERIAPPETTWNRLWLWLTQR